MDGIDVGQKRTFVYRGSTLATFSGIPNSQAKLLKMGADIYNNTPYGDGPLESSDLDVEIRSAATGAQQKCAADTSTLTNDYAFVAENNETPVQIRFHNGKQPADDDLVFLTFPAR